eukprot:GHVN01034485.1.p1 GENE.GHVN01034485.1~~GHVN01034485.1.p1  ORF type:complete len:348 (-),score=51.64 GHVN01034485.1:259-1302(-)
MIKQSIKAFVLRREGETLCLKASLEMDPSLRFAFCPYCGTYRLPGSNCKVRVAKIKCRRKRRKAFRSRGFVNGDCEALVAPQEGGLSSVPSILGEVGDSLAKRRARSASAKQKQPPRGEGRGTSERREASEGREVDEGRAWATEGATSAVVKSELRSVCLVCQKSSVYPGPVHHILTSSRRANKTKKMKNAFDQLVSLNPQLKGTLNVLGGDMSQTTRKVTDASPCRDEHTQSSHNAEKSSPNAATDKSRLLTGSTIFTNALPPSLPVGERAMRTLEDAPDKRRRSVVRTSPQGGSGSAQMTTTVPEGSDYIPLFVPGTEQNRTKKGKGTQEPPLVGQGGKRRFFHS